MPTIVQARTQISQARQTIQQRQQSVTRAETELQKVKQALPKVTAKSLRQVKDALTARIQRDKLQRIKKDISTREAGIKKFKLELSGVGRGIGSYETQIKKVEAQIKQQEKEKAAFFRALDITSDPDPRALFGMSSEEKKYYKLIKMGKAKAMQEEFTRIETELGGRIQSVNFELGTIQYAPEISSMPTYLEYDVPTYDTSASYVSTKTGEVFTPSQKDLPDWAERIGFKVTEGIRTDPFLSRISEPSILKEDITRISPGVVGKFEKLYVAETYGEVPSIFFPKLIPSTKEKVSDFIKYTPSGRILKDIRKLGIDITKTIGRKQAELELRARGIPVTEENIKLFQIEQRRFVKTEISPTLEIAAYGAMVTPGTITKTFSFFGKTKVPEVKYIPEKVTVSKIKYYEDVGGDYFAIKKPLKDIPDNIFFAKTGTVKAGESYIVRREIGKTQDWIVKRAAIVKADLKKLPKIKDPYKDYQKPLYFFRDMPKVSRPSGVRVYTGEKPKPKTKKTPFDKTFGMQPTEEIYQLAIKRLKVKPKKVVYPEPKKDYIPKKERGTTFIFKPKPEPSTKDIPKITGKQIQLLKEPKLKKKPKKEINYLALTDEQLAQLKKIRAAAREQPSLLNIQSELFPTPKKVTVTRFVTKEISEGKIKPLGIVSVREEVTTKELDKVIQPSIIKTSIISVPIIKERIKQQQPEKLKQPLLLKSALKQPLVLEKASVFRQIVRERLKTERVRKERIKKTRIIPIKEKVISQTSKGKITKVGNLFNVYVRRAEQDILIGTANSLIEAKILLKSVIETTLAASGFIEKGKQRVKGLNLGISFRPAKREPTRIVERRARRLKKGGQEVREILGFKKRKERKNVFGL